MNLNESQRKLVVSWARLDVSLMDATYVATIGEYGSAFHFENLSDNGETDWDWAGDYLQFISDNAVNVVLRNASGIAHDVFGTDYESCEIEMRYPHQHLVVESSECRLTQWDFHDFARLFHIPMRILWKGESK